MLGWGANGDAVTCGRTVLEWVGQAIQEELMSKTADLELEKVRQARIERRTRVFKLLAQAGASHTRKLDDL
jgi:hypothetical protein